MYKLGVDIGGTKMNIGLFDENKTLAGLKKVYISEISSLSECIKANVLQLCKECDIDSSQIISCGIGIPGTVDKTGRKIIKAPNLRDLFRGFAEKAEAALKIPVRLVQDSRAAAWGEYIMRDGPDIRSLVCVTLGTGIGTGIILDGRIYDGPLGCSGEVGHFQAVENGRQCGCGKYGCVEKYAAGGGLDITAKELLGDGKTAIDLFREAENGNKDACTAIDEAVVMLGRALVAVINVLSPEILLFSGGLSGQEALFVGPLKKYIETHCYSAGGIPVIKAASLAELSPLFGAAFIPMQVKREPVLSASLMCADILNMEKSLREIEQTKIKYLHCDIMDNHFVPNLMLSMEFLNKLRCAASLPFEFHIMAEKPESIIEKLEIKTGDHIIVHYESTVHLHRVLMLIKEKGALAGVALNPATPVEMISEVLTDIGLVLIMSVNPGFAGQRIVPSSFDKILRMKKLLTEKNQTNIKLEVDGNCSFENVPKMYEAGADIFVVGSSSVFKKGGSVRENAEKLLKLLNV